MQFEYDPEKSKKNKEKHGIDFEEAKELWNGEIVEVPVESEVESRFMVIGKILEKFWSAFITYREAVTRIISVRRSRDKEKKIYENNNQKDANS
ncbi:MAG: BrnT family toxin [Leptospiraceae bacterium]|nr:BrnT family toxin [Leptospiraceae bacterium]